MKMQLPAVGSVAPDFSLPSTSGDSVTLSSFRGTHNVLIAFFPLAFTGTCTAEMCDFSNDYAAFQGRDTVVLPISVDAIPTLTEFKAKERMAIDLLSDFHRTVSRQYGTLVEERNHSTRAYILIDKAGVVRWAFAEPNPGEKRTTPELLHHLDALG
jgi:peroxiredoxin (alkyl hydroperoxide reductase subunit C)